MAFLFQRRSFMTIAAATASRVITGGIATGSAEEAVRAKGAITPEKPSVDDLLWALPEDIESVLVSKAQPDLESEHSTWCDHHVPADDKPRWRRDGDPPDLITPSEDTGTFPISVSFPVRTPFLWPAEELAPHRREIGQLLHRFLVGDPLRFILIAARRSNLERQPCCDRCWFSVFHDPIAGQMVEEWSRFVRRRHSIDGHPVLEFLMEEGPYSRLFRRYVVSANENTILTANNLDMISVTMDRIGRPAIRRALPADLPEWRHVDTSATAWGLRHYAKASQKSDPFSMPQYDPEAQGMVVFSDEEPPNSVVLRYISPGGAAASGFSKMIEQTGGESVFSSMWMRRTTPERLEAKFIVDYSGQTARWEKPLVLPPRGGFALWCYLIAPILGTHAH